MNKFLIDFNGHPVEIIPFGLSEYRVLIAGKNLGSIYKKYTLEKYEWASATNFKPYLVKSIGRIIDLLPPNC